MEEDRFKMKTRYMVGLEKEMMREFKTRLKRWEARTMLTMT